MPNMEPHELPIPSANPGGMGCANVACVDAKPIGNGEFLFTSTLGADKGSVRYNHEELVQFFGDVKAGNWDHLLG
jgi:hypothetical protein